MQEQTGEVIARVRAHYEKHADREWYRLPRHRMEYAVTLRALRDTLAPSSRILDVGGGPGRYAVALAAAGHHVTLLDLAPRLLERARDHAAERKVTLAATVEGSALDLSRFDNAAFDAVLMLGPLYHLPRYDERLQALHEARRVLAPGGLLVAMFAMRYAPLRRLARRNPRLLIEEPERFETLLQEGILPGPADDDELPHTYYACPDEIAPLLAAAAFAPPRLLAVEGLVDGVEERINGLEGAVWTAWADLTYDLAEDPALLAGSSHVLAISRKDEE